ncbi:MAG: hypothetical protein ACYC6H_07430 [Bellilinea sp.]
MTAEAENINSSPEKTGETQLQSDSSPTGAEAGKPCPVCGLGIMDYDGLLNLVCPVCGCTQGGCFT